MRIATYNINGFTARPLEIAAQLQALAPGFAANVEPKIVQLEQNRVDVRNLVGGPVELGDRVPDNRKLIPGGRTRLNQLLAEALSMRTGCVAATASAELSRL